MPNRTYTKADYLAHLNLLKPNGFTLNSDEIYKTTLPAVKIAIASVANNFNFSGQKNFYDQSYKAENGNERPHVDGTNGQSNTNVDSFSINKIIENSIDGSGGDYLSNEIFYRIAKKREDIASSVKTGHYHLANPDNQGWTLISVLQWV